MLVCCLRFFIWNLFALCNQGFHFKINLTESYVNLNPELKVSQVAKEIERSKELESELKEFKAIRDIKQYNKKLGQKTSSPSDTKGLND